MDKDLLNVATGADGWIVAVIALVMGYLERKSAREQDRLGKTFDCFDGGAHAPDRLPRASPVSAGR